ncbi:MAG TPA: hypothetical protein VE988_10050 [Gemmataceae bacterium]|nr:hypothetical protein [Gemmataceae bacterium]
MTPDYDSPWKESLEMYFQPFLALLFQAIHDKIDWSHGFEFLDKELQQLIADAEQGRRYVDKLVKVWAKEGIEMWVLIHIEVQTTRDTGFPRRMYVYNYRIDHQYDREVVSIAVLADDDPNWRPDHYEWELWGCRKRLDFPHAKLLDFIGREAELQASDNPFAQIILAHLAAIQTRGDDIGRMVWKVRLMRGLFERGFTADHVRELFRLIDWLMQLPPAQSGQFWDEVKQIQEVKKMPFITTPERIGMEKGMEKGREEGTRLTWLKAIEEALEARFGEEGLRCLGVIGAAGGDEKLRIILRAIVTATTLEEAKQSWSH